MITDSELREHFALATDDVPSGPDLETSINRGRRSRRRRRAGLLGGAVAGMIAAAAVAGIALSGSGTGSDLVATDPAPSGAADFVSGTDHDQLVERTVARHLPSLPRPDDVYPSDWDHRGPMPDADFADATDWQAAYTVSPTEELLVLSGYAPPGEKADPGCPGGRTTSGGIGCHRTPGPDGWITDDAYTTGDAYVFYSTYVVRSGFTTTVLETVTASSWDEALDRRAFVPDDLHPLLTDADLAFPLPASRR
ncbi:hypothetical protein [Nocardioides sp.]|uniref:hypothetical protein n=1 Tax=Nocardioides sp. TaxID=35761 RepID=UPI0025DB5E53|nr:hypothetical protein [Nocardioides sp.]